MPQMGVSVAEGTVVEWKKQVGDWVEADEIICSISTDKIDTDVESPATGRVAEIIVNVGDTVDVGVVMAKIATDARPGEAHASENDDLGTGEAAAAVEAPGEAGELIGDDTDTSQAKRYSPVVMRMAAEHNLDLSQIAGTGRGGRISKKDVLAFMEGGVGRAADAHRVAVPARRTGDQAQAEAPATARRRSTKGRPGGGAERPAWVPSRSRGCARPSARAWCSRCRPRRPARPSPRRT